MWYGHFQSRRAESPCHAGGVSVSQSTGSRGLPSPTGGPSLSLSLLIFRDVGAALLRSDVLGAFLLWAEPGTPNQWCLTVKTRCGVIPYQIYRSQLGKFSVEVRRAKKEKRALCPFRVTAHELGIGNHTRQNLTSVCCSGSQCMGRPGHVSWNQVELVPNDLAAKEVGSCLRFTLRSVGCLSFLPWKLWPIVCWHPQLLPPLPTHTHCLHMQSPKPFRRIFPSSL